MNNPLRYPGGKTKLANYISTLIEETFKNRLLEKTNYTIIEPYSGSAAISIELLNRNLVTNAVLVELDPLIYSFWHSVFNNNKALIELIENTTIDVDTWKAFQCYKSVDALDRFSTLELGFAGLFFNRTNFSGILNSNPIGGLNQSSAYAIDCRFNKERIIKLIENLSAFSQKVQVVHDDALNFLEKNINKLNASSTFLYVDPPYFEKGKQLYRHWHSEKEHEKLYSILINTDVPWLVSYDNHDFIKKLYLNSKKVHPKQVYFDYSVHSSRKTKLELLLSNLEIPPSSYILDLEA